MTGHVEFVAGFVDVDHQLVNFLVNGVGFFVKFHRFVVVAVALCLEEITVVKPFLVLGPLLVGSLQRLDKEVVRIVGFCLERRNGFVKVG